MSAQQIITQHLDIWTAAHKTRSGVGRGSSNKLDLYGIKKLRELILELAVRGKLVPQDPNDEPASELLKKIAAEKARLIKEGKIKKEKPLPEITDEEKPFELPSGWAFTRLGELVEMFNGRAFKSTEWSNSGLPIIRIQNLNDPEAGYNYFDGYVDQKNLIDNGTFLISWSGTPGTSFGAFIWKRGLGALNQHINKCEFHFEDTNLEFMRLAVNGQLNNFIAKAQGGVGLKHVTKGTLNEAIIAFPCLAEQRRIAAKVDELMTFCDQLGKTQSNNIAAHAQLVDALLATLTNSGDHNELQNNWQRIAAHFDTLFTTEHSIEQLKQTILQLAVMGKLVPQNPNDEPASELLKKIAGEKAQLIKEGKIKKEKPLPEITDEEKPFELPNGWEWARVGQFINLISGQHLNPNEYSDVYVNGMFPYLTGPADFGDVFPEASRFTSETRALAREGDILITCKGSGVGKLNRANKTAAISRQLMSIQNVGLCSEYLFLIMDSLNAQIRLKIVGIAIPGISREDITYAVTMLPPLSEQHRIVTKVNELMALCDTLKTNLQNAQTTQLALADALVESVIGVSHSSSAPVKNEELSMEIKTSLELNPNVKLKKDAVLANIINAEEGSIDAKRLWQKSKMDLPSFYKQLKREISAGYILKPAVAEIQ